MNKENALERYSNAYSAVTAHTNLNTVVFDEHKRLVGLLIDAENELRDAVAEAGASVANSNFRATLTPQTQTYADIEEVDALAQAGRITQEERDKVVKTVGRPPRISIHPTKTPE